MLNMDPVVQVNVSVGADAVISNAFDFDVGAILTPTAGTGTPLTTTSRYAVYSSLKEVLSGVTSTKPAFADTTDVYSAAYKYFGVTPAPEKFVVVFYDTTENTTETPTSAMMDAIEKGAEFYGVYYSPKSGETAANIKTYLVAIASALDSLKRGILFYGVTGTASSIIATDGLMDTFKKSSAKRVIGMACTSAVDDVVGLMGVAMGYARIAGNSTFALCYKPIATATANGFTQAEVDSIKALNGNVYVKRTKTHTGIECGATASGLRFDDVLYLDMIAFEIQNNLFDLIADSPTKLPQNDSTSTLFISEINRILEGYYNIGLLNTNVWHGTLYNGMEENTIIEHGYYAFAPLFDDQSAADRAAHKAVPITVLLCLAGSVESVVINLEVQT